MIQSAFESLRDGLSNALWIMMIGQKEKILDDFFKTEVILLGGFRKWLYSQN